MGDCSGLHVSRWLLAFHIDVIDSVRGEGSEF